MDTPIVDFVKNYNEGKFTRLHMPGHKGQDLLGFEHLDVTEFDGADCLYSANGIIKKSRENASDLFGANTFYSAEGSSLCIRAMLYLALKNSPSKNGKPFVLAGRNAHKSFVSALGLLDVDVKWIYPEKNEGYLSCTITAKKLEDILSNCQTMPIAVYITTPDYLGGVVSVKELSIVCKKLGVLLLVDNAHGAYLKFLPQSMHPIDLGADMCCDSAHKTLPALTGSAYLHLSKSINKELLYQVEHSLSIFGSTSPSYLILQSLDATNKYISEGYKEKLNAFIGELNLLKTQLTLNGYTLYGKEPLKLTINAKAYGYTGIELNQILKEHKIFCEFYDPDYLVMMFTPESKKETIDKVEKTLLSIPKRTQITTKAPAFSNNLSVLSVKDALLSPTEKVNVENALGRIFADLAITCPPAVPIAVCGDKIDKETIDCFKYFGINACSVVKE